MRIRVAVPSMVLARASLFRYSLPFVDPLTVADETLTVRKGLLLRLEAECGATGWGEAAPLIGFSRETLAEADRALDRVAGRLPGQSVGESAEDRLTEIITSPVPPSVQFAIDSARIDLAADGRGIPVAQWLDGRETVELNGLITAETADLRSAAQRYLRRGFRTVKLKVGREDIDEDVRRVWALADALGDKGRIRLDANRAWTVAEAVSFADALDAGTVDYVEEPLSNPERLPALAAQTGMPVALDETTREWAPRDLSETKFVAAVVLKPTLLGGLTTVRRWAQSARAADAVPVVSASYESGVGVRMLAALASSLSTAAAGLTTYEQLDTDVLAPRLSMEGPTVDVAAMTHSTVHQRRITRTSVYE